MFLWKLEGEAFDFNRKLVNDSDCLAILNHLSGNDVVLEIFGIIAKGCSNIIDIEGVDGSVQVVDGGTVQGVDGGTIEVVDGGSIPLSDWETANVSPRPITRSLQRQLHSTVSVTPSTTINSPASIITRSAKKKQTNLDIGKKNAVVLNKGKKKASEVEKGKKKVSELEKGKKKMNETEKGKNKAGEVDSDKGK